MNESKEQLENLLSDYVDGNLSGEALKSAEAYLESNPGIRDAVNRMMIDSEAIRSLPRVAAPFDFSEDVRGQSERDLLLEGTDSGFTQRRRVSSYFASAAAMLIMVLGLGGGAYWVLSNRPAPFMDVASNVKGDPASSIQSADTGGTGGTGTGTGTGTGGEVGARPDQDAQGKDEWVAGLPMAEAPANQASPASPSAESMLAAPTLAAKPQESAAVPFRRELSAIPAPVEVAEMIDEAPRFNGRAVVLMMDGEHAASANLAVQSFVEFNKVQATALAFDARRNRAVAPEALMQDALAPGALAGGAFRQADSRDLQQVSGVMTNAGPDAVAQAIDAAARMFTDRDQTQVVLARGLTSEQAAELQGTLQTALGASQALAYELDRSPLLKSAVKGNEVEADRATSSVEVGDKTKRLDEKSLDEKSLDQKKLDQEKKLERPSVEAAGPSSQPALLAAGERLKITLIDPDASNLKTVHEVAIGTDGTIALPSLPAVKASDMTMAALRQTIVDQYVSLGLILHPVVDVELHFLVSSAATQGADLGRPVLEQGNTIATETRLAKEESASRSMDEGGNMRQEELLDVYLVVRGRSPASQPVEVPATMPTSQPQ